MTWDDLLDRLRSADLDPVEEIYMENYGKILARERKEFHGRNFRCTYGVLSCSGLQFEAYVFPSLGHLEDFLAVIGDDPWWIPRQNVVLHFPLSDPAAFAGILDAVSVPAR